MSLDISQRDLQRGYQAAINVVCMRYLLHDEAIHQRKQSVQYQVQCTLGFSSVARP